MFPKPTELLLPGYSIESIWTPRFKSSVSRPNTNLQTYWQNGISLAMSGTVIFICLTSAISAPLAALRISAWPVAPKRWWKGCKNRKERTGSWLSQSRRRWTWPPLSWQVLRLQNPVASKSPGILKAPCRTDKSSTGKLDAKEHNQNAALSSQGWQKDVVPDVDTRKLVATEEDQEHLNYPEDSVSRKKLVASGNSETEGSPYINKLRAAEGEGFLDRETKIWFQPDGSTEGPRCEHSFMVYIFVCHSSSCSSSW